MTELERAKKIHAICAQMVGMPYRTGGGHNAKFQDDAYDCSGAVCRPLKLVGRLSSPPSQTPWTTAGLMLWGRAGRGKYVTLHVDNFPEPGEEHCGFEFTIPGVPPEQSWFQAANPGIGIGWFRLSNQEIAAMAQRHWPNL